MISAFQTWSNHISINSCGFRVGDCSRSHTREGPGNAKEEEEEEHGGGGCNKLHDVDIGSGLIVSS